MDTTNFSSGTDFVPMPEYFFFNIGNNGLILIISALCITIFIVLSFVVLFLSKTIYFHKKKTIEIKEEEDKAIRNKEQNAMLQRLADKLLQTAKAGDRNIPLNQRWELIKKEIDRVHNHFTVRLKARFTKLKEDEINLCCLIRIGMDTYKIIQYLDISKDYLRKKRSRLAQVLKIQNRKRQLEQFIVEF